MNFTKDKLYNLGIAIQDTKFEKDKSDNYQTSLCDEEVTFFYVG